jgi:hypothetical protein
MARLIVQITRETLAFGFLHFDHLAAKLMDGAFVGVCALTQLLMVETRRNLRSQRFERPKVFDLEALWTASVRDTQDAARAPRERHRHTQEAARQVPPVTVARPDLALVDKERSPFEGDGASDRFAQPHAHAIDDRPGDAGRRGEREQPIFLWRWQQERRPAAIDQPRRKINRDRRQTVGLG